MAGTLRETYERVRLVIDDSLLPIDPYESSADQRLWEAQVEDYYELHCDEAPTAYAVMHRVRESLGVSERVVLFQVPHYGWNDGYNAFAGPRRTDPLNVLVAGRMLEVFGEGELAHVFGHELAHYYETDDGPDLRYGGLDRLHRPRVAAALRLAREMSCDRVGLVASRSRPAALIVEAYGAAGLGNSGLKIDPRRYLERARAWVAKERTGEGLEHRTHPPQLLRVWAIHEFGATEEYREITGVGPATRTLESLDEELRDLLLPESVSRSPKMVRGIDTAPPEPKSVPGKGKTRKPKEKDGPTVQERVSKTAEVVGKALEGAVTRGARWLLEDDDAPVDKPAADFLDPLAEDEKRLLERFAELEKKLEEG